MAAFPKIFKKEPKEEMKTAEPAKISSSKSEAGLEHVLKRPRITEKASMLAESSQYVFEVFPSSSKGQVKDAVQAIYGVQVIGVNILHTRAKKVRVGRRYGTRPQVKKAVVTLKKGEKIEVVPV